MGPNNDPGNNLNVAKLKTMISDGNISQQESGKINKIDKEGLSHITKTSLKKVANSLLQKGFSTKDKKVYISYKKMIDNYTDKKIPSWKDLEKAVKMNLGILSNALVYNGNFNDEDFHGIQIIGDEIKVRYDAIGTNDTLNLKYDADLGIINTNSLKNNWTKENDEETDFKNTAKVDKGLLKGVKDVKKASNGGWDERFSEYALEGSDEYNRQKEMYEKMFENGIKINDLMQLIDENPLLFLDLENKDALLSELSKDELNIISDNLFEKDLNKYPEIAGFLLKNNTFLGNNIKTPEGIEKITDLLIAVKNTPNSIDLFIEKDFSTIQILSDSSIIFQNLELLSENIELYSLGEEIKDKIFRDIPAIELDEYLSVISGRTLSNDIIDDVTYEEPTNTEMKEKIGLLLEDMTIEEILLVSYSDYFSNLDLYPEKKLNEVTKYLIERGEYLDNIDFFNSENGGLLVHEVNNFSDKELLSNAVDLLSIGNEELSEQVMSNLEYLNNNISSTNMDDTGKLEVLAYLDNLDNLSEAQITLINEIKNNLINSSDEITRIVEQERTSRKKSKSKNV